MRRSKWPSRHPSRSHVRLRWSYRIVAPGARYVSSSAGNFGGLHGNILEQAMFEPLARHPSFATGFSSFVAGPFVRGTAFVGSPPSLAGNLALLATIHRGKSACHMKSPSRKSFRFAFTPTDNGRAVQQTCRSAGESVAANNGRRLKNPSRGVKKFRLAMSKRHYSDALKLNGE